MPTFSNLIKARRLPYNPSGCHRSFPIDNRDISPEMHIFNKRCVTFTFQIEKEKRVVLPVDHVPSEEQRQVLLEAGPAWGEVDGREERLPPLPGRRQRSSESLLPSGPPARHDHDGERRLRQGGRVPVADGAHRAAHLLGHAELLRDHPGPGQTADAGVQPAVLLPVLSCSQTGTIFVSKSFQLLVFLCSNQEITCATLNMQYTINCSFILSVPLMIHFINNGNL